MPDPLPPDPACWAPDDVEPGPPLHLPALAALLLLVVLSAGGWSLALYALLLLSRAG